MWRYDIKTGALSLNGFIAHGYSGAGADKNNPASQDIHDRGPIPVGHYTIGPPVNTDAHGPFVLGLTPAPSNHMAGRGSFLIHGDSLLEPGTASKGCIILSRAARELIWQSGDHALEVVAGDSPA